MRKLITVFLLITLDLISYIYLKDVYIKRNEYPYTNSCKCLIYQISDIKLNNIDEFEFNKYFELTNTNYKYNYEFIENTIKVTIDSKDYYYSYELIEPEVIEKIIYKENNDKDVSNEDIQAIDDNCCEDNYTNIESYYFNFPINTDLDEIRNILINNISTTNQTSIDYSRLNINHIGRYSVFYVSKDEKIEVIVEIS